MKSEKIRITIIDFLPHYKKLEVGKYEDGDPACIGDCVKYNNEDNWFIVYRYGDIMLKQIGMMAMVGLQNFDKGDFSKVEKTNIVGAGNDWIYIGYPHEPMYDKIKILMEIK